MRLLRTIIYCLLLTGFVTEAVSQEEVKTKVLTDDGAWCWFSTPRAIYRHADAKEIVTGWVTEDGSIEAALLNLENGTKCIQNLNPQLDKDDHANPAFVELADGSVLVSYTKHSDQKVRFHKMPDEGAKPEFGEEYKVHVNNEAMLKEFPRKCVTYANTFELSKEDDRVFVFGRWTGFKPNLMWSDDGGDTFEDAKVYITNYPFDGGNRPYVRYFSDGKSKIHVVFTDGHPRNEPVNSVYYACYEKGAFWKADGTKICDLENIPFEPKDATMIYQATPETGRAWVYDIAADKKGRPVVLYARYPSEKDHIYHYAKYDGDKWLDHKICHAGKWFPQTVEGKVEKEPHYSAAMTVHPNNPDVIYLCRDIDGVFELERRETGDDGKSWEVLPITKNSKYDNVRPVVPKNMKKGDPEVVLWMENEKYVHYTDYKTKILYYVHD